MKRRTLQALIAAGALATMAGGAAVAHSPGPDTGTTAVNAEQRGHAPGGPFTLTDHKGRQVTDQDYRGKFLLVFFGYTFCPDVCPTTLAEVALTLDLLGDDANALAPLFISVDPGRDSPAVLAEYVDVFHPDIIGLTGTADQVTQVARGYMVHFERAHDADSAAPENDPYYRMDHSSFTYLMGPDGSYRTVFAYGTPPERMAEKIRGQMAAWTKEGV